MILFYLIMRMSMMKCFIIILTLLALGVSQSTDCHYSCLTCLTKTYSNCSTCPNNQNLTFLPNPQQLLQGTCAPITTSVVNPLGISYLFVIVLASAAIFDQEIIHLTLFIQSLGLLYLVEVNWWVGTDYILNGLTYFMMFSKMTYQSKVILNQYHSMDVIKGRLFFGQFDISGNIGAVGGVVILVLATLMGIGIFKQMKKKFKFSCMQNSTLERVIIIFSTIFIFLIQQMTAVLYFCLKHGNNLAIQIGFVALFLSSLMVFIVFVFFNPLPYFRNRNAQLNIILGKTFCPLFVGMGTKIGALAFIAQLICWIFDFVLTRQNRKIKQFNRLVVYKIIGLITISFLTAYYGVDLIFNYQIVSYYMGIISTALICLELSLPFVQIGFNIWKSCCQSKKNSITDTQNIQKQKNKKKQIKENNESTLSNINIELKNNTQLRNMQSRNHIDSITYDIENIKKRSYSRSDQKFRTQFGNKKKLKDQDFETPQLNHKFTKETKNSIEMLNRQLFINEKQQKEEEVSPIKMLFKSKELTQLSPSQKRKLNEVIDQQDRARRLKMEQMQELKGNLALRNSLKTKNQSGKS